VLSLGHKVEIVGSWFHFSMNWEKLHLESPEMALSELFTLLGSKIRAIVEKRQNLLMKLENLEDEIGSLKETKIDFNGLIALADHEPALAFLEAETENDPEIVKKNVSQFQKILDDNEWEFKVPPLGPLFSSIEVKNEVWCCLIEKIISNCLCTFVVDNTKDEELFNQFLVQYRDAIHSSDENDPNFQIKAVVVPLSEGYNPPPMPFKREGLRYTTLFSTLHFVNKSEVEENRWKNLLCKKLQADHFYLFPTEHDAFVFMHGLTRNLTTQMPYTGYKAFSLDGFEIHPFPQFKTKALRLPKKNSYIRINRSDKIRALQKDYKEWKETYDTMGERINTLRELQLDVLNILTEGPKTESSSDIKTINSMINMLKAKSKDPPEHSPVGLNLGSEGRESHL